ncbi:MAG: hypothetical protein DWQ02_13575 [Bacteroidetes bacterium]|nr:MAG: hypothetical protein DWQ02_13575 [Bacteroidota bacterium]
MLGATNARMSVWFYNKKTAGQCLLTSGRIVVLKVYPAFGCSKNFQVISTTKFNYRKPPDKQ